jgi:aspartyl-tRNA(Asn)/glutamyl-tRNA(Gln) amidotransferase subunit B
VDFNRTGIPLLEIVSEPDLNSPQEAFDYLTALKNIIEYLDVSDCDMEKGSLRCDANVSLRLPEAKELGVKTELKNMNSFKGVKDALAFEVQRQSAILEEGGTITQETRLWDAESSKTISMRTKEGAKDYRYFPDPDLTVFIIERETVSTIEKQLPELPQRKIRRFVENYGLTEYDAKILAASRKAADFAELCIRDFPQTDKKEIVNWLIGPLLSEANQRKKHIDELGLNHRELIELALLVQKEEISHLSAKTVLGQMLDTSKTAGELIREGNLGQISDSAALNGIIDTVIRENLKSVNDFKAGKANALMYLVGQVMKKTAGKANPKLVGELIGRKLSDA